MTEDEALSAELEKIMLEVWKPERLDSPCIAVCTTLFDEVCKGCGRTYIEVSQWPFFTKDEQEVVWQRIDAEASSWRYTTYKDRVPQVPTKPND